MKKKSVCVFPFIETFYSSFHRILFSSLHTMLQPSSSSPAVISPTASSLSSSIDKLSAIKISQSNNNNNINNNTNNASKYQISVSQDENDDPNVAQPTESVTTTQNIKNNDKNSAFLYFYVCF